MFGAGQRGEIGTFSEGLEGLKGGLEALVTWVAELLSSHQAALAAPQKRIENDFISRRTANYSDQNDNSPPRREVEKTTAEKAAEQP